MWKNEINNNYKRKAKQMSIILFRRFAVCGRNSRIVNKKKTSAQGQDEKPGEQYGFR